MSFKIDPSRLGCRTCGPVRYVPWYLFFSCSRRCFVICEHLEAPQAVGTSNNPINQASLIQLSDSSYSFLSQKVPSHASGLAFSPFHSHLGTCPLSCLPWCYPLWQRWLQGLPTTMPVFFLGPDQRTSFLWTLSYTPRFPNGLISKELWYKKCYQTIIHIFNFLSSVSREPFIMQDRNPYLSKLTLKYLRSSLPSLMRSQSFYVSGIPSFCIYTVPCT